jgi:hypothetical protein
MTETTATPQEHSSLVGGSTAARRINCPGSLAREAIAPKSKGSSYAREGTALHELIAQILDENKEPDDLLPFRHKQPAKGNEEPWELEVDSDLWYRLGQPALDMFDGFLNDIERDQEGLPAVYMVEESGEFPGIPGAFGTSDVPFRCGKIGGIWDWKFGRGPVKAEENAQLMFYFAVMLHKFPKFFDGIDRVMLCISQPQVNDHTPDVWETDLDDIAAFGEELKEAIALAQTKDAPIEKGPWCKFADCKAVCELYVGAAASLGEKMAELKYAKQMAKIPTHELTEEPMDMGAFLSEAMDLADMAQTWAKHIAGMTQERLEAGLDVPNFKVVPKKSAGREWNPDLEEQHIINRLRNRGLKSEDYYTKKIITAPQAIAALKKAKAKPLSDDDIRMKPSSGYTLTREDDPRQAADPSHKKAAAIGASLLAMTQKEKANG